MALAELVADTFPVTREQLLTLLIELEGHPDNAVPSFLGGFAVCAHATADPADGFVYTRVPVKPELSFVTLVPDLKLSTETARGLLPKEVPFRHAVANAQRTARIAAAFALGDYAALRGMFVDSSAPALSPRAHSRFRRDPRRGAGRGRAGELP